MKRLSCSSAVSFVVGKKAFVGATWCFAGSKRLGWEGSKVCPQIVHPSFFLLSEKKRSRVVDVSFVSPYLKKMYRPMPTRPENRLSGLRLKSCHDQA